MSTLLLNYAKQPVQPEVPSWTTILTKGNTGAIRVAGYVHAPIEIVLSQLNRKHNVACYVVQLSTNALLIRVEESKRNHQSSGKQPS